MDWKTHFPRPFLCMLYKQIPASWVTITTNLHPILERVEERLVQARREGVCYPPEGQELQAFKYVGPGDVKVIICGQDPYHGPGQAHGLAFSVAAGVPYPPSLRNMLKEAREDLQSDWPVERSFDPEGALGQWARNGVLLLNDVLTVKEGAPGSHADLGWQVFTGGVLDAMAGSEKPLAVLLWGKPAQRHRTRFSKPQHLILEAPHPSPLSAYRGFFGSRPYSQANAWLEQHGVEPVDWMG